MNIIRIVKIFILFLAFFTCMTAPVSSLCPPARGEGEKACSLQVHLRCEYLLQKLSLEQKIGQMLVLSFHGGTLSEETRNLLHSYTPGGLILYTLWDNIASPGQVVALVKDIQNEARDFGMIPPFIAVDQEGGVVNRISKGATHFPGNMALGATRSQDLGARQARITAEELRALGITWNFAPVVDVNNNPENPIINVRSFGESPELVASMGTAMVGPYEENGVLCTAKHYPGHGNTAVDSHKGLPRVDTTLAELEKTELLPFKAMIKAGVPAIMTAHVVVPALAPEEPALPATLSREVLQNLREQDFQGLIVTDSMGMGAIVEHWGVAKAAVLAVQAGADMLLYGADPKTDMKTYEEVFTALMEAVNRGDIEEGRIDESVRRILTQKILKGLLDDPFPRPSWQDVVGRSAHGKLAETIALQSLTLVKDSSRGYLLSGFTSVPFIVPLGKKTKIQPLLETLPQLEPIFIGPPAKGGYPGISSRDWAQIEKSPVIVVASWNLGKTTEISSYMESMKDKKIILLALKSPYDLKEVPWVSTCLCTYGDTPATLQTLGELLRGIVLPWGSLPVTIPELYGYGWKVKDF